MHHHEDCVGRYDAALDPLESAKRMIDASNYSYAFRHSPVIKVLAALAAEVERARAGDGQADQGKRLQADS